MERYLVTEFEDDLEVVPMSDEEHALILPIISHIAQDKYAGRDHDDPDEVYGHMEGWEEYSAFIPDCGIKGIKKIKVFTLSATLLS